MLMYSYSGSVLLLLSTSMSECYVELKSFDDWPCCLCLCQYLVQVVLRLISGKCELVGQNLYRCAFLCIHSENFHENFHATRGDIMRGRTEYNVLR